MNLEQRGSVSCVKLRRRSDSLCSPVPLMTVSLSLQRFLLGRQHSRSLGRWDASGHWGVPHPRRSDAEWLTEISDGRWSHQLSSGLSAGLSGGHALTPHVGPHLPPRLQPLQPELPLHSHAQQEHESEAAPHRGESVDSFLTSQLYYLRAFFACKRLVNKRYPVFKPTVSNLDNSPTLYGKLLLLIIGAGIALQEVHRVLLTKPTASSSLGFSILGVMVGGHVYACVKGVSREGPAHADGNISVGDKVLQVHQILSWLVRVNC